MQRSLARVSDVYGSFGIHLYFPLYVVAQALPTYGGRKPYILSCRLTSRVDTLNHVEVN